MGTSVTGLILFCCYHIITLYQQLSKSTFMGTLQNWEVGRNPI